MAGVLKIYACNRLWAIIPNFISNSLLFDDENEIPLLAAVSCFMRRSRNRICKWLHARDGSFVVAVGILFSFLPKSMRGDWRTIRLEAFECNTRIFENTEISNFGNTEKVVLNFRKSFPEKICSIRFLREIFENFVEWKAPIIYFYYTGMGQGRTVMCPEKLVSHFAKLLNKPIR